MKFRRATSAMLAAAVGAAVTMAGVTQAHGQELALTPSREIEPPVKRAAAAKAAPTGVPGPPMLTELPGMQRTAPAARPLATPLDEADRGAIFLRADRLEGEGSRLIEASGNVELRARRETVLADWLEYDIAATQIHAKGNVVLRRGFDYITGSELKFRRDTETGVFEDPKFFIAENGGRGEAREIRILGPNDFEASESRYTTCVAPNNDWFVRSDELEVDKLRRVGTAHHATIFFLDVPVMYAPWLEFPLSGERKTGFLTPIFGSTQIRGFEAAAPYYLNLAPNYDATLVPRYMTKRGFQLGAQGRYLFEPAAGEVNAELVPVDQVTDTTRWAVSWKHNQQIASWLAGYFNYNRVSDNLYLADYADRVAITSQKTLPQEAGLVANQGPWSVLARVQQFQTLQDPSAPVTPPYNMLPQIRIGLAETAWREATGFTFGGLADFTRFSQSALVPTGDRGVLYPSVRWLNQGPAYFFNAHLAAQAVQYALNQGPPQVPAERPHSVIPIASIDAGLVFERDWEAFGTRFTQTLEPRAFYTYIPFRDQTQQPKFDTVLDDYNFTQLFSENRYIGYDRVGDANQLSVALQSRLLDPDTGAERLRVAIGERFYFYDQKVTLGEPLRKAGTSDLLVGAEGRLSETWAMTALLRYDVELSNVGRLDLGGRYSPAPGKVFNATYRYSREQTDQTGGLSELKQVDLSGQWPVGRNVTVIGRWNYSIVDHKTLDAVAGLEYNGDCWVLRVVGQRLTTTSQQTTNSVFVQLELNGLARVGTSPLELLRRSVPGYLRTNDPAVTQRDRSFDPLPEF